MFYKGHHWDPAGCPVYSGTSLLRTPLGPSWLSCIQWNLSIVDTIGAQLAVLYTVEPLYRGHHWGPAGCPVYSGTSLLRTPLGPSWLSCIQWNLSIVDTIETQLAVLHGEVSLILTSSLQRGMSSTHNTMPKCMPFRGLVCTVYGWMSECI